MAPSNLVKVLEVCKVAPTPESGDSGAEMSLPLTFFDVFWLRFHPNQRLFFYEASHLTTTLLEIVLPKLKHSLSITLQHYLPIAGNLIWAPDSSKPIAKYTEGDAVSLTVAESDADFFHLSGNQFREAKEFHPLLPELPASEAQVPVMALQVTLFPNSGFSIGYAAHHAVVDGKSIAMFMRSWAFICRHGGDSTLPPELTPFYGRTVINDPSDLEKTYLNGWLDQNGPNNKSLVIWDMKTPPDAMLGTFQLTQAHTENIKKWVQAQWQEKHKQKPSIRATTFAVTSAYVWVCLIKARKLRTEKVHFVITADCRARLKPSVPSTYFGNCITACIVGADLNELMGENGVAIAARAIGEAVQSLDDELLKAAEGLISSFFSIKEDEFIAISGSNRFEFYGNDFGWGKPTKVELISNTKSGAFSLSDSREGNGGVEIGIVLKEDETEGFASLFASGFESYQVHETSNQS